MYKNIPCKGLLLSAWLLLLILSACNNQAIDGIDTSANKLALSTVKDNINNRVELNFSIQDGKIYNKFYRQKEVAAHTLLTAGTSPRLVVAFPAGNSGVSLWFEKVDKSIDWQEIKIIEGVKQFNQDKEPLYGIQAELITSAKELRVKQAVLSNVRIIRDYLHTSAVPEQIENEVSIEGQSITWYRDRLDGIGGYKLQVTVLQGSVSGGKGSPIVFKAPENNLLTLRVTALTGDKPLTPIEKDELLLNDEQDDSITKNILAFLSYEEKLLAGSWRFATYFGRDTLMSTRLLMPILNSNVIEAALGSVIERLDLNGEVAHEEDLAEFAVLRHIRETGKAQVKPFYDYKMVDDDYLLAPIVAKYLLEHDAGKSKAKAFLQRKTTDGKSYGQRLVDNFNFVLKMASPYANDVAVKNLIKLRAGHTVGEWRDSGEGLGYGKIPYNVNAVFVPAALTAISTLNQSGLLNDYLSNEAQFNQAENIANVWLANAARHFKVTIAKDDILTSVSRYAYAVGVSENIDHIALEHGPITFNAVSLDPKGQPIPVLNSDDGFSMLFAEPSEQELVQSIQASLNPYPIGLLTPVGMVVANPAYASVNIQKLFTNAHYHGAVIWSWQQALFAAGLERQLQRDDLSADTINILREGQRKLWLVIKTADEVNNAELWSWSFENGRYKIESFGQRSGDKSESNAAQLWSTVYLAITEPKQIHSKR